MIIMIILLWEEARLSIRVLIDRQNSMACMRFEADIIIKSKMNATCGAIGRVVQRTAVSVQSAARGIIGRVKLSNK